MNELSRTGRITAIALWCSFLAACAAALFCFAFIDPEAMRIGNVPDWWTSRIRIYSIGFFFFWLVALVASALTLHIVRTDGDR